MLLTVMFPLKLQLLVAVNVTGVAAIQLMFNAPGPAVPTATPENPAVVPDIVSVGVKDPIIMQVVLDMFILLQGLMLGPAVPVTVMVNVPPPSQLLLSIITTSADVGTDAPPGPLDTVDQWDVSPLFQSPEPPTQYLNAIY
jgi:hypothetical protein